MASRTSAGGLVGAVGQEPARSLHVIGDRRQRLIEFVGKRRGHLAHRGEPRHVDELGLQFLQPGFGLLPLGEVADEAGEEAPVAHVHFADRELHGKRRAVVALPDHDAADADDPPLSGAQIAIEVAVVIFAVGRRHQHLDVLSQRIRRGMAEQPFRRRAERLDEAAFVDHDHGVGNAVENRCEMRRALLGICGACRRVTRARRNSSPRHDTPMPTRPKTAQVTQSAGDSKARKSLTKKQPENHAKRGGHQSRTPAAECRGDQDRRDKEQVRALAVQHVGERQLDGKACRNGENRDAVLPGDLRQAGGANAVAAANECERGKVSAIARPVICTPIGVRKSRIEAANSMASWTALPIA